MNKPNHEPVSSGQDNLNAPTIETSEDASSVEIKPHLVGGDEFDLLVTKDGAVKGSDHIVLLDTASDTKESAKDFFVKNGITVAEAAEVVRSSFSKK